MSLYNALNKGDASISERHITSFLYYLFANEDMATDKTYLQQFINKFIPQISYEYELITIEVEEILSDSNSNRMDCDITVRLKILNPDRYVVINLENKISNNSYRPNQLEAQSILLKNKYPDHEILSFYILPYESTKLSIPKEINKIYWLSNDHSLTSDLAAYLKKQRFVDFLNFLSDFSSALEQEFLTDNSDRIRSTKNPYSKSMFDYLKELSNNWPFASNDNVTVRDLLEKFAELVKSDLEKNGYGMAEINQFKRGAWEAQPKIMTINERNRNSFGGIKGPFSKALFFYPDFVDGNYKGLCKWKDLRILPISQISNYGAVTVFWKDPKSEDILETIYEFQ